MTGVLDIQSALDKRSDCASVSQRGRVARVEEASPQSVSIRAGTEPSRPPTRARDRIPPPATRTRSKRGSLDRSARSVCRRRQTAARGVRAGTVGRLTPATDSANGGHPETTAEPLRPSDGPVRIAMTGEHQQLLPGAAGAHPSLRNRTDHDDQDKRKRAARHAAQAITTGENVIKEKNPPPPITEKPPEHSADKQPRTPGREVAEAVARLVTAVGGICRPPTAMIDGYLEALAGLPEERTLDAISELLQTADSHVPPARIRRAVLGHTLGGASEAWEWYQARLKQVGAATMRSTDHPDPNAQRAFMAIGAAAGVNAPKSELPAKRQKFIDAYQRPPPHKGAK